MRSSFGWLVALGMLASPGTLHAAEGVPTKRNVVRPAGAARLITLSQNWSDKESEWFYNVAQGSRLMPYLWFVHLEEAEGQGLFRSDANIAALGYIPRKPSVGNPDGLPVGFIKDADYDDKTAGLGITCAACHTGLITHKGTAILVDGGPTQGDFSDLLERLVAALKKTLEDGAKFDRFAAKVLPAGAGEKGKSDLKTRLTAAIVEREKYNKRNLPKSGGVPFGPGRVDAFGAIFNEVASTFLEIPENEGTANAPVSYPCLWDAPQHDVVQWTGTARNWVSKEAEGLFGTDQVGALGRNTGEVLGVFGHAKVPVTEEKPGHYPSTANKANLLAIEKSLTTLWSPKWPEELFGRLDEARRKRGELQYCHHCKECHAVLKRDDEQRTVTAVMRDVGTDRQLWVNSGRSGKTGRLEGRIVSVSDPTVVFGKEASIGSILTHVVQRAMMVEASGDQFAPAGEALEKLARTPAGRSLDYSLTAALQVNGKEVLVPVAGLFRDRDGVAQLKISSMDKLEHVLVEKGVSKSYSTGSVESRLQKLNAQLGNKVGIAEDSVEAAAASSGVVSALAPADVKLPYKARPLNGVWATAPYLHNGSVRTLADLLKPVGLRQESFHVGGLEFDPNEVGFKNDPKSPQFNTQSVGNRNIGHEFGTTLSEEERLDLLEYLKSL